VGFVLEVKFTLNKERTEFARFRPVKGIRFPNLDFGILGWGFPRVAGEALDGL
jgi:hypothetical protein